VTLGDFLSFKNDVNVASKSKKQKKLLNYFFAGLLKVSDENSSIRIQDPDPLVRGMEPRIRIRIHLKMSWIRNTDKKKCKERIDKQNQRKPGRQKKYSDRERQQSGENILEDAHAFSCHINWLQ
jgi:hypothetical protein